MDQFAQEAAEFGISLTNKQLNQFDRYLELLLVWNQRLNLTAIRDPRQIKQRHFLDALTCSTVIQGNSFSLIDIGTGAGFPGLPLKILIPSLHLTLVESITKKAHFLEIVVADLELSNVEVVTKRAEILGQDKAYREQFDWVVARGVAKMQVLMEYLLPLCRVGGHVLAQKGGGVAMEINAASEAIKLFGGGIPKLYPVHLPEREEPHYLVLIEKLIETPEKYPRRSGIPAKRPL